MRRSRRIRLVDVPRLALRGIIEVAALFGGRYRRTEGAHVLVTDAQGRVLVVRTTYLGPGWSLPGGRVERDEAPHEAATRETREETGIEVAIERLVLVEAGPMRNVSFVFLGRRTGGQLEPQFGEISEVGWLSRDEIAASSEPLDRLLRLIPDGPGVAYVVRRGHA